MKFDQQLLVLTATSGTGKQLPCEPSSSLSPATATDVDHDDTSLSSATSTKSKSQTASVKFSEEDNVVHDILPLSEYTTDEIRACWFSRGEYNVMKRNSLVTLSLNRTGELSPDDPEHTMRGLECRTRECTDSRRMLRYRAASAVLEEQARQRQGLAAVDPELLSETYHSISWHAMYDAHCQGLADEQDCSQVFSMGVAAEGDFFAALPASSSSDSTSSKRNTVLSKIISIDRVEEEEAKQLPLIAGFDCELWSSNASATSTSFNLNSFFNDMSLGIAVAAA